MKSSYRQNKSNHESQPDEEVPLANRTRSAKRMRQQQQQEVQQDADVLHDVPVHNKHWRDMKWYPVERVFYYDKQGTPPDGIPTADANGYHFVSPTNNDVEVRVVFDQSKDIMMKGYENELKDLLERLDKMEVPKSPEGICNHLFGEQSRLMQNLVRSLGKDATDIHKFLATVYFAAELGLPVRRLQEHSYIAFDKFMDCKTLNAFWNDIAAAGKDGDEPTYLWQTVEEQLNEDCCELFLNVKGRKYKLRIALDDDKVHFQFSTMNLIKDGSYMCGLAACQHVKCNRKGFTIDSAVSDAEVLGNGEAAYLQVSSSQQELLRELIPNSSERIQILHHAYTYGSDKTTFLVGGPEGNLLFGLTITFEEELLRAYGEVLKFLYKIVD